MALKLQALLRPTWACRPQHAPCTLRTLRMAAVRIALAPASLRLSSGGGDLMGQHHGKRLDSGRAAEPPAAGAAPKSAARSRTMIHGAGRLMAER